VLAKYAQKFGADENRWWFLTGERQALYGSFNQGFNLRLKTPRTRTSDYTQSRFAWSMAGNDPGYYGERRRRAENVFRLTRRSCYDSRRDLPTVNAALNLTAAILIGTGLLFIKQKNIARTRFA